LKSRCQFSHTGNQDGEERRPRSSNAINPKELYVEQLKEELGLRGSKKTGSKDDFNKKA